MGVVESYPLAWPAGRPRTLNRRYSRFGAVGGGVISTYAAIGRLNEQLRLLDAKDIVISSNLPVRRDGLPRSVAREPDDSGVAVYLRLKGDAHCLACDRWEKVAENIAAIAAHIYALRGQVRWGVGDLAQAFAGYRALPAMGAPKPWWEVLALPEPPARIETVETKWRDLIRRHHPDAGGDGNQAAELNAAWQQARKFYASEAT